MSDVLQLMGLALRARGLVAGEEVVADAVSTHRARLLLVAEDAARARCARRGICPPDGCGADGTCRQGGHRRRAGQRQLRGGCGAEGGFAARIGALLAEQNPEYQEIAAELARKQAKRLRRKKEKPRKR